MAATHVPRASKPDPYKPIIISKLEELERQKASRKMRWTAVRMHEWLVEEMGITALSDSYLLVQRFMRKLRDERKKSYRDKGTMPLIWHPGEAQCDFGEADFLSESGQTVTLKYIVLSFPNSNKILSMASPGENCQCVCQCLKDIDLENRIINIDHQLQRVGMKIHIETTKTNAGTRKIPMTEEVYRCFPAII